MLVLKRKKGQQIVIDPTKCPKTASGLIVLTVVEVRGDGVRLGTEADKSVVVHRREVWDAIQKEAESHPAPGPLAAFVPAVAVG